LGTSAKAHYRGKNSGTRLGEAKEESICQKKNRKAAKMGPGRKSFSSLHEGKSLTLTKKGACPPEAEGNLAKTDSFGKGSRAESQSVDPVIKTRKSAASRPSQKRSSKGRIRR